MKTNVFDYLSYKSYLKAFVKAKAKDGRGFKAKLAEAIGCQRTFVSQVLQAQAHFNLEHGDKINAFLEHSKEEAHFFLLLIQLERAGTESLRHYFREQINSILNARLILKNRIASEIELTPESEQIYYSTWYYAAVCIALTITKLRTREALAKRLKISKEKIIEILDFLVVAGLAEQKGDEYFPIKRHLHLGKDSLRIVHHMAWRAKTMQSLEQEGARDLHYSTVISLSVGDASELKKMAVDFIESLQKKVAPSPEETLCVFGLDLYEL